MNDVQNSGNYDVKEPDDLVWSFGEIADQISQSQLRKIFVNQHVAYYQNDFASEVQEISIPDEGSSSRRNTNELLGNLLVDVEDDNVSTTYMVAQALKDVLDLNINPDAAAENYDLILADIVTSPYYKDALKENFDVGMMDTSTEILGEAYDLVEDKLWESDEQDWLQGLIDRAGTDMETLREEWHELALNLDALSVTEDSQEYARIYGKCSVVVDKYVGKLQSAELMEKIQKNVDLSQHVRSLVAGGLITTGLETVSDAVRYWSCMDAYYSATDMFCETLAAVGFQAAIDSQSMDVDTSFYGSSLMVSINNFYDAVQDARTDSGMTGKILEMTKNNAMDAFSGKAVDVLFDALENTVPAIKLLNGLKKTLSAGLLLVDLTTKVDDRVYASNMLYQMFFMVNCSARAADLLGGSINSTADLFTSACRFDVAVHLWRCCALMYCDFGIEYETYRLQAVQKKLNVPVIDWDAREDASWFSTAISITAYEKQKIEQVRCHQNIDLNPNTSVVDLRENAQVICIACPVSVRVTDSSGAVMARLEDGYVQATDGYEPYFHVIETEPGSGDYMKICYIPESWQVSFSGTGTGEMSVVRAEVSNGSLTDSEAVSQIPVEPGAYGTAEDVLENPEDYREPEAPEMPEESEEPVPVEPTEIPVPIVPESPSVPDNLFIDVPYDSWYADAVSWAVAEGITDGTSQWTFSPYMNCTRGQMVTFLWHAAGDPGYGRFSSFRDVSPTAYYAQAVAWAEDEGLVNGTSPTTFSPDQPCTRGQIVTILWRFFGSPHDFEYDWFLDWFDDVPSWQYYAEPVAWALVEDITTGIDGARFGPNEICNRAQMVTFLYRSMEEENSQVWW